MYWLNCSFKCTLEILFFPQAAGKRPFDPVLVQQSPILKYHNLTKHRVTLLMIASKDELPIRYRIFLLHWTIMQIGLLLYGLLTKMTDFHMNNEIPF